MNAALWLALAFSSSPANCRPCHAALVDAYLRTGMGRSISAPAPLAGRFYHRLSNRHYRIEGNRVRRSQLDAGGVEINVVEKSIDLVIGSGNHARTLVHRSPQGRLLELPITWYSRDGGFLAMSPGYDRPDHLDFRREINDSCLFCHAAYPQAPAGLPRAIDCERCHGTAAAHLAKPGRGNILNPAKFPAARQLDLCLSCHLETASRGIPDSVRLPGRNVFSFQPGERLAAYKVHFDRAEPPPQERFEVNHAGYRLLQSACFQRSAGRLTCTTCHDPHTAQARQACAGCHQSSHSRESAACAGCHMPQRRAQDAIHVTMTDHWIQRKPVFREPEGENHAPYTGDIVPFYTSADPKLLALARALQRAERERTSEVYRALPESAGNLAARGEALLREGNRPEARKALERSRRMDPADPVALNALAVLHATEGRLEEALALLEISRRAHPGHPLTWLNLGVTWEAKGDRDQAIQAYNEAIRLQPDFGAARHRLATVQASTGDFSPPRR
jgi:tetratricopeptide (TPR) repeat protein